MHASDLTDFTDLQSDGARMRVRRGYEAHAPLLGLAGAPTEVEAWIGGGRRPHPLVLLPTGERALVRAYRRGGVVRHLNRDRYFLGHRAFRELRATEAARRGGVRTPLPLAATERPAGLLGYRAWLATLWIPGARDAAAWLEGAAEKERERMLREAGRQVARMHAAGVAHPDLNLRNLLVAEEPGGDGPAVYVLDFDRARVHPGPVPRGRRARDLERLARSARKLGAPVEARGWAALREGYGSAWPLAGGTP